MAKKADKLTKTLKKLRKSKEYYIVAYEACRDDVDFYRKLCTHSNVVVAEIAAERKRQAEEEGFGTAHDDMEMQGELARAAACYAYRSTEGDYIDVLPLSWPWNKSSWKPKGNPRYMLIKAGALIVAEIERLDRLSDKTVI